MATELDGVWQEEKGDFGYWAACLEGGFGVRVVACLWAYMLALLLYIFTNRSLLGRNHKGCDGFLGSSTAGLSGLLLMQFEGGGLCTVGNAVSLSLPVTTKTSASPPRRTGRH